MTERHRVAKGRRRQRLKGPNDARRVVRALGDFFFLFFVFLHTYYCYIDSNDKICDREASHYETDPNEVQGSLGKALKTKRAQMTPDASFWLLGEFSSFFFVLF